MMRADKNASPRARKEQIIADFDGLLANAQMVILAENTGLTVAEMTSFRGRLAGAANDGDKPPAACVVKNTLARRALSKTSFTSLVDDLHGPLIYGVGSDPVALARIFVDFAKENKKLKVRCGGVAGGAGAVEIVDLGSIRALASMPSREALLARLAATTAAPISGFLRVLNEIPASAARAIDALRAQKEAQESQESQGAPAPSESESESPTPPQAAPESPSSAA